MNFEAVIGLEIHVEMKTKSKMFSPAPVTYGKAPNSATLPIDLAHPGTMPTVNRQAVINAIRVSHALNMDIDSELWFDRKNYFYSDLPKGFQITQNDRPIGKNGYLFVETPLGKRRINITRLHLEEDTAMQHHLYDCTLLDYNRAGIPLVEIVSEPEIRTGLEAADYVDRIRSIVTFTGVSNGKMEEGSLRCDVNISLRPIGSQKFGTKVEIKNINSISNVARAVDYEIMRQSEVLLSGNPIVQETRRYDDALKETVAMRLKTDAVDYKYFIEPNLIPITLSEQFINDAIATCPELADSKYRRYVEKLGLSEYDASILISSLPMCQYFDALISLKVSAKMAANWLNGEISAYLNKHQIDMELFPIDSDRMAELLRLIDDGTISNKQARDVFAALLNTKERPLVLIEKMGMQQLSDRDTLLPIINAILDENSQSIADYKQGKDRAFGYIVGQVMRKTGGKANPSLASQLVKEEISKR
ncbi:MAG TPA: Asp-tRNA(Asn)/Glu-tRNA(Gln) amidotransferase GatCAB subunit B [Firmicutes bacterium]|jgi:aspartyl-tRNA(Asn)/glutamyl-tRNA(Gln) amidotransferase subunit B|nr:Asp-tRNA(Asn)/Glu-tRNA(Gln) amidotransferase GatCAB subunit B [Bacillota bacterium]